MTNDTEYEVIKKIALFLIWAEEKWVTTYSHAFMFIIIIAVELAMNSAVF